VPYGTCLFTLLLCRWQVWRLSLRGKQGLPRAPARGMGRALSAPKGAGMPRGPKGRRPAAARRAAGLRLSESAEQWMPRPICLASAGRAAKGPAGAAISEPPSRRQAEGRQQGAGTILLPRGKLGAATPLGRAGGERKLPADFFLNFFARLRILFSRAPCAPRDKRPPPEPPARLFFGAASPKPLASWAGGHASLFKRAGSLRPPPLRKALTFPR
jgi:hypothetical protein